MGLEYLLLLALVQGITEFLPISSSGHLILLPRALGVADQGLALDVAVHVGTLAAVVAYCRAEAVLALGGLARLARGRLDTPGAFLALCLMVATVPVGLAGLALHASGLDAALRSPALIGWAMLGFGLVLWWADRTGAQTRPAARWSLKHALILGFWQVLALIPGTSRAGITITGARLLGYARPDAARLSMLMAVPTIIASGLLTGAEAFAAADWALLQAAAFAALMAFGAAFAALWVMMRLASRISFTPYVIYRVVLGVALIGLSYSGALA